MITYGNAKYLGPLHCDNLSFTLAMPHHEHAEVKQNLDTLLKEGYGVKSLTPMYAKSVKIGLGAYNTNYLGIQIEPKLLNKSYLRAEFNPAKVAMSEIREHLDNIIPGGYDRLISKGKCTRIDIAVDIHHAKIHELLIHRPGMRTTSNYYSKHGLLQTHYLGSKLSDSRLCVYDKVAQIKRHNAKAIIKGDIPDHPITRIEARLQHGFPAKHIEALPNPFATVSVATPWFISVGKETEELFTLAAQVTGATTASHHLSPATKKVIEAKLKFKAAPCWKPDILWSQWPEVAAAIVSPPYSAGVGHLGHNPAAHSVTLIALH